MIIFAVVWAICYHRGKAPRFVRYGPIFLAVFCVPQTLLALIDGNAVGVLSGLTFIGVYLGLAVFAAYKSKPQVDADESRYAANEWNDADKEAFRQLMDAQRRS
jgi:hypothetical protein